ncbi:MAG: hypothetical protein PHU85_08235 [Phycisphaerae bacterium]|nr:hypothetical protein [Phycisphaerae bacterium]
MLVVLVGLAGLGTGYGVRDWEQRVYHDIPLARSTYEDLVYSGSHHDMRQLESWRKHLKGRLLEDMKLPIDYDYEHDDGRWGRAFYVMNNNGRPFSLWFAEGMDPGRQDELIRYLCFVIENEARRHRFLEFESFPFVMVPEKPEDAFKFLVHYPQEALNRNSRLISNATWRAFNGQDRKLFVPALGFIASEAGENWGSELCVSYLERVKQEHETPQCEILFSLLYDQSVGDPNKILYPNWMVIDAPKPSERVQAGSLALLKKYEGPFGEGGIVRDRGSGMHYFPSGGGPKSPLSQPDRKP